MANFKSPLPVKACPRCGRSMGFGERVKVTMAWERDGSYRKVSCFSGIVCRECAEQVSNFTRISRPGKGEL